MRFPEHGLEGEAHRRVGKRGAEVDWRAGHLDAVLVQGDGAMERGEQGAVLVDLHFAKDAHEASGELVAKALKLGKTPVGRRQVRRGRLVGRDERAAGIGALRERRLLDQVDEEVALVALGLKLRCAPGVEPGRGGVLEVTPAGDERAPAAALLEGDRDVGGQRLKDTRAQHAVVHLHRLVAAVLIGGHDPQDRQARPVLEAHHARGLEVVEGEVVGEQVAVS